MVNTQTTPADNASNGQASFPAPTNAQGLSQDGDSLHKFHISSERPNGYAIGIGKPLFAFALFALVIATACYFVFQYYQDSIRQERQDELAGIANLKIKQITSWMDERRSDAQSLKKDPLFISAAESWLQKGGPSGDTKTKLLARLSALQQDHAAYGYVSISLFDEHGILRLSSSTNEPQIQGIEKARLLESMRSGQIVFSDIHREKIKNSELIEIELRAPLSLIKNGTEHSIGAVLFRIDPERFLFPLIQLWPTSSPSAESLLVRRDANDVVFLNQVRHSTNTSLAMRLPLSQTRLPAAMAALGHEGLVEGNDYRGVPVVGVLNKIPGTSWMMVSKIDETEIYAPIKQLTHWLVLLMLSIVGTGGGIGLFWRHKEKKQYEGDLERRALALHLDFLTKYANDIILLSDDKGKIIDFNNRALEAYGYSAEDFLTMNISDLRAIDFTRTFGNRLEEINHAGELRFESMHVRRNGEQFPVEACVKIFQIAEKKFHQGIIRDISERKQEEEKLKRVNRALQLLSACNTALVHIEEEDRLLEEICKLIVEAGGYKMAWVGFALQDPEKTVQIITHYGNDKGYLNSANISWADTERGRGPTGTSIRTGHTQISQNFLASPLMTPWKNAALACGYQSSAAIPLKVGTKTFGSLTIYSAASDSFISEEVVLLEELAADLAWGINALRTRREYEDAVVKLRQSEEHFRFLIENARDMVFLMSPQTGRCSYVSPASTRVLGYAPEEFYSSPMLIRAIVHPDSHNYFDEQWNKILHGDIPSYFEYRIIHKSGEMRWVNQRNVQIWKEVVSNANTPTSIQGVITDVTERKLAEAQFENEHIRLRTLIKTIPDLVWLKNMDGVYLSCNLQMERLYGATEAGIIGKTDYDFVDKELADWFHLKDMEAMAADGARTNEEWVTYPDNGQRVLLETIKTPMRDMDGKLIGVMGIARDITGRKQAEERESRLRHTLDNTLDMIFMFRPDTLCFVYANKGAIDSIGYSNEELLQMTPSDIKPHFPEPEFRKLIAPLVIGEKELLRYETSHRCKSGIDLPVEVQLQLVKEENGESLFVAIVRDIAERKRAETELQRQKSFMWQVIDTDPSRIFVKDINGKFLLVNRSTATAHGLTPKEMVGKSLAEINHFPEEVEKYLAADRKVITEGSEINLIEPYSLPNGEQRWLLTFKKRLTMPDETLSVLGISVDITQQKHFEIQLAESYKELQRLSLHLENIRAEERAKIALNLHDEMGATLATLKMRVSWLASKLPAELTLLSAEAVQINELIADGIHTMHHIVNQLRPDILGDVEFTEAIKVYVKKFMAHTDIECILVLPKEELAPNAEQSLTLFRILQEALNNVVKHARASRVDILMASRGETLVMEIRDNGIGFDPAMHKKHSLGLLGIRERALMVGGEANVSSTPGKGVCVSVSLPPPPPPPPPPKPFGRTQGLA